MRRLAVAALLVSACSMAYELLLAQASATLYGNAILRYTATIGAYLFALGAGALVYAARPAKEPGRFFVALELAVAAVGGLAPLALFGGEAAGAALGMPVSFGSWLALALVVAVGLLSGLEIPALLAMARETKETSGAAIIAADFAGTCVAAVAFPLVIYPKLGLIGAAAVTGLATVAVAAGTARLAGDGRGKALAVGVALAALLALMLAREASLRETIAAVLFAKRMG